ncbi:MAG: response regulator [Thermodesulfobacteriota bacterium]|nr:response regulator [Thermodesulfobacteriota bacterium]
MKLLIVDDEAKIANVLAERLEMRGFDTMPVYDGESALDMLQTDTFYGMILDLRLPGMDGIEVLEKTRRDFPDIKVVILSGHANDQDFETCRSLGAVACFQKPANIEEIVKTIETPEAAES